MRIAAVAPSVRETNYFLIRLLFGASLADYRWSPKYFPADLVARANGQLKHKMLFGSDFPLIAPDRWIADFKDPATGFKPEVHDLILKQNAIRALRSAHVRIHCISGMSHQNPDLACVVNAGGSCLAHEDDR